jgi:hypothetical protein
MKPRQTASPVCLGFFQLLATKSCCRSPNALAFQPAYIRIALVKTVQNQHEHKIGRIVMIVGICCFLNPEPFRPLHLPPHVIHTIFKFFSQPDFLHNQILRKAGQKKAEPNMPMISRAQLGLQLASACRTGSGGPSEPSHQPTAVRPAQRTTRSSYGSVWLVYDTTYPVAN